MAAVLVIAHRGLPGVDRPENTTSAVLAALQPGVDADGVEVDVRLTADGVLAVCHDPDLGRLTGIPTPVARTAWPALLAAGQARGVELARLEQVLGVTDDHHLVVEVKKPPPGAGASARTANAVCGLLRSAVRVRRRGVTVSSFSPELLHEVRILLPARTRIRTALLGRPLTRSSSLLRQALDGGHDEVHPYVMSLLADPDAVAVAHALGVRVVPWTVNRGSQIRRLARHGVDGVITDVPQSVRSALGTAGTVVR